METTLWQDALNLLFPARCAGCGAWDTPLCAQCWLLADGLPRLNALDDERGVPHVPLWSLGNYGGALRRIILAAKHQRGGDLSGFLFQAGCRLGQAAADNLGNVDLPIWVIPAPSSRRRRWDGQEVTGAIAAGVIAGLEAARGGRDARLVDALRLRARSGSQSMRGKDTRSRARRGSMRLAVAPPAPPGRVAAVLVDDVCTTGATLTEMARHLGNCVQAAAVLARA